MPRLPVAVGRREGEVRLSACLKDRQRRAAFRSVSSSTRKIYPPWHRHFRWIGAEKWRSIETNLGRHDRSKTGLSHRTSRIFIGLSPSAPSFSSSHSRQKQLARSPDEQFLFFCPLHRCPLPHRSILHPHSSLACSLFCHFGESRLSLIEILPDCDPLPTFEDRARSSPGK